MAGKVGAPVGNKNSIKNSLWIKTINRAIAQHKDPDKLRKIAEKLIDMAEAGDIQAIKELGDRLDGKPKQAIEGTGENGSIIVQVVKSFDN